ncbi:hypothetical protein IWQ56_000065 [Coemansia nantahalensis]|nr:hypothetical protein IWQ56_000065 [Coemansia nantahalensis]
MAPSIQQQQHHHHHSAALAAIVAQQASVRAAANQVPAQHAALNYQAVKQVQLQSSAYGAAQARVHGSPSSRGDGSQTSESDCGMQKLGDTMAAMSLTSGRQAADPEGGLGLSDRAQNIQRVREASALGKLHAFGRRAVPDVEEDCPSDLVPLGDLRQALGNTSLLDSPGPMAAQQQQQQVCGADPQSPTAHSDKSRYLMLMHANPMQGPGGTVFQQAPPRMALHMLAGLRPGSAGPLPGHAGQYAMPGMPPTHQQLAHLQQMAYQRGAASSASLQSAGAMYRSPMQGSPGVPFGGVDQTHMGAMLDYGKYGYTPSPLGQAPVYCQPAMDAALAMSHPDMPLARHQSMMARYAQPAGGGAMAHPQGIVHQHQQQAALTSYIPNSNIPRGSLLKNPLMRDLNKVKEFSARDYASRPTLLAEADSRRLAKKTMPGLGGTTSHSIQQAVAPPPPPPQPMQQYPPARYQPLSQPQQHEHHDHYDPHGDPREAHYRTPWPESECRRRPSRQRLAGDSHGYASSASESSTRRRGGARGQAQKRRQKHAFDHDSEYEARGPPREFRPREAPHQHTRSRRAFGGSRSRRRDDREYSHYDYDDDSDSYASGCYDECDGESNGYDDGYSRRPAHGRRRTERVPPRSSPRRRRTEMDSRWDKPPHRGRAATHRPRAGRLDDPRDDASIVHVAARPARRDDGAADAGAPASQHAARPRSQLGRFLANIKRQARAPGPQAAAEDSEQDCGDSPDAASPPAGSDAASPSEAMSLSPVHAPAAMDQAVVGS